jgi:RND family efflux transporter MFP subunit
MNIRKLLLITTLVAFPLIAWSIVSQEESSAKTQKNSSNMPEIKTIKPGVYEQTGNLKLPATLEAAESVDIYARADGYLAERYVDIGSEVEKGQVLAVLASPELEDKIHQAKAEIRKQQSLVALTEKLAQRYEKLRGSGVVSIVDVEKKVAEYEMAKAVLKSSKAKLAQLNEEYAYTRITAPFSGVITERQAEIGQRISATDAKSLFTLNRNNELKAVLYLPQSKLMTTDLTSSPSFIADGSDIAINDLQYLRKATVISDSGGTMRVEYLISDSDLVAGMTGNISLKTTSLKPTYILPLNTIRMVDGKPTIQRLAKGKVDELPVEIEAFMTNDVRLSADITSDDRILINPNALLDIKNEAES